jgi:hypothetical protein
MDTAVLNKVDQEFEYRKKRIIDDLRRRGRSEEDIQAHLKWMEENRD